MLNFLKTVYQKIIQLLIDLASPPWDEWDGFTFLLALNFVLGPILCNFAGEPFFGSLSVFWFWYFLVVSPVLYAMVIYIKEVCTRKDK